MFLHGTQIRDESKQNTFNLSQALVTAGSLYSELLNNKCVVLKNLSLHYMFFYMNTYALTIN